MKFKLNSKWYGLISIILLFGLSLLFLWRVAFKGDILLSLDMLLTYEPWRSEIPGSIAFPLWNELMADPVRSHYSMVLYVQEAWQNFQTPFWYPYGGLGIPIQSSAATQVLYPVNNILWQILPVAQAFGWSTILHLFMGGVFTFLFLGELGVKYFGRLVGAITFTYSGSLVMWLGSLIVLDSMVWMPFIFFATERSIRLKDWRWSLLGALGVAMQILAGHIQLAMYTFTALLLYAVCRMVIIWHEDKQAGRSIFSPLTTASLVLAIGSSLVAYQLFTIAELVPQIRRGEGDLDLDNSPLALLRILIPDLWGNNIDGLTMAGYRFETYLYLGVLPLFFIGAALFSQRAWLARSLFGMGIFFLLPIFNVPPFYQLFYYLYPTFSTLGLARMMFIIVFFWAATAGIGADWLLAGRPVRVIRGLMQVGLVIGGIALVYLVGLSFVGKSQARHFWNLPDMPDLQPSVIYHVAAILFFLVILGASLALLRAWSRQHISPQFFATMSIVLIVLDLFATHIDYTPVLPKHLLYPVTPSLDFLQQETRKETEPFRISGVDRVLWPNTSGVFSLPVIQVYDSFLSNRYFEYADASGVRAPSNLRVITFKAEASRLIDALNVKYLYTPRDSLAAGDGISLLYEIELPQVLSDYAEAGQIFEWAIDNWSQEVLLAPAPTVIQYQGVLPGSMRLETAIAIDPQFWDADGITFEIYATVPGGEAKEPVFSQSLDPRENFEDRQWVLVQVDLSEFANQPVLLSFVTQPAGIPGTRGGWADPMLVDADQWDLLYYGPNSIYQNKRVLPRAWIVHRVTEVAPNDIQAAKVLLARPDFDPVVEAVVEGDLPELMSAGLSQKSGQGGVNITNYDPSRIEISATTDQPGLLVLSDLYYPGWQVYVDGQTQPVLAANLVMRSVYLEPGEHTVVFSYEPQSFRWGVYISIGVLVGIVIALVISWWRYNK